MLTTLRMSPLASVIRACLPSSVADTLRGQTSEQDEAACRNIHLSAAMMSSRRPEICSVESGEKRNLVHLDWSAGMILLTCVRSSYEGEA